MISDWGVSNQDTGSFPDDDVPESALIRAWWYEYLHVLKGGQGLGSQVKLCELTDECERRGIVKPHRPMPRTGAEDLADQCDEAKKHMWGK